MKIEISGYTLTNDSGDTIALSVEEYDRLKSLFVPGTGPVSPSPEPALRGFASAIAIPPTPPQPERP